MDTRYGEQAVKLSVMERQIIEKQAEVDETAASLKKLNASLPWTTETATIRQRLQAITEYEKNVLTDLEKAEAARNEARQELIKATERARRLTLRSPIDGTVQQLSEHTIGGVVTPGKTVMVIVPDNPDLVIEARVANEDVGFVHPGQQVEIKVDAFSFTRYGFIDGKVLRLSRDALTGPDSDTSSPVGGGESDRGAQKDALATAQRPDISGYVARIALASKAIRTENGLSPLEPGMKVTVEINTGRRSVISYLLSPLDTHVHDADFSHFV